MKRWVWIVLCLLLLGDRRARAQTDPLPRWEPTPCPSTWVEHECGYLVVPEDHTDPDSPTIRLMVGIVHSVATVPLPDPVVILVGGPGNRAVGTALDSPLIAAIREQRNLIFLDQRGSGFSEPNLECPQQTMDYVADVQVCHEVLSAQAINLAAYTTTQNAADVEMLRQTLGIEQWNLWGTSYGTRLALAVMRDYPNGIRSVILDSVLPLNNQPILDTLTVTETMFHKLFAACHDDLLCNTIYPNLQSRYESLFERLERQPVTLTIHNTPFVLDGDALMTGLLQLIADRGVFALLPSIIADIDRGDYELAERLAEAILNTQSLNGMALSTICTEEAPFIDWVQIEDKLAHVPRPYRPASLISDYELCQLWLPDITSNLQNKQAVVSDIPTLLLVGEYDSATPPQYTYRTAETLANGYVYEFARVGHVVITNQVCPMAIALTFLIDPTVAPDGDCAAKTSRIQFSVGIAATRPWAWFSALILGLFTVALMSKLVIAAYTQPHQPAWLVSGRLVGWLVPLGSASLLVLVLLTNDYAASDVRRLVEIIVPLAVAFQAAFAFTPDSDPSLEVLMACPRRPLWILLERLVVIMASQGLIAIGGVALSLWLTKDNRWGLALLRWIPPMLMLSGIAVYITVRSRMAIFAMMAVLLVWFGMVVVGDALLPPNIAPYPLSYLQPWLWPFQPYLKPERLAISDYWLNRAVVAAVGLLLLGVSLGQVEDEERMLTGDKA